MWVVTNPSQGVYGRQLIDVSLSLPLSLKSTNISSCEGKKIIKCMY